MKKLISVQSATRRDMLLALCSYARMPVAYG